MSPPFIGLATPKDEGLAPGAMPAAPFFRPNALITVPASRSIDPNQKRPGASS
jgi:hypothetical protein